MQEFAKLSQNMKLTLKNVKDVLFAQDNVLYKQSQVKLERNLKLTKKLASSAESVVLLVTLGQSKGVNYDNKHKRKRLSI